MALNSKVESFAIRTTAGSQVVTGVGFQPKVVLFWLDSAAADGTTTGCNYSFGVGISSSARRAISWRMANGSTPNTASGYASSDVACIILRGSVSNLVLADLTSMDADGFTLNVTTAPAAAYVVNYMALAGADLTNAAVGTITSPASTGVQNYTGVGFQPDALLFFYPTSDTSALPAGFNFGVNGYMGWASASAQGASGIRHAYNVTPAVMRTRTQTNVCLMHPGNTTIAEEASFNGFTADGFSLNWSATSGAGKKDFYLALKGPRVKIGAIAQPTTTGVQSIAMLMPPKALILLSGNKAASSTTDANARFSVGISDGTTQAARWIGATDATIPTVVNRSLNRASVLDLYTEGTPSLNARATAAFTGTGIDLNWTAADATQREVLYFALADATTPGSISGITPATVKRGASVSVTVTGSGTSFDGATTVAVSGSGVTVSGISAASATSLSFTLAASTSAAVGARVVTLGTAAGDLTTSITVEYPISVTVVATTAAVMDADTGVLLWEQLGTTQRLMASTTKTMTLLLLHEYDPTMSTVCTVSATAAGQTGTTANLLTGEVLTAQEAVYGMMLPSGNDAAWTIAENIGNAFLGGDGTTSATTGGVAVFVARMNARAAELGMVDTHYDNPSGLDSGTHHSSAIDMCKLGAEAFSHAELRVICSAVSHAGIAISGGPTDPHDWPGPNSILASYPGTVLKGGGTGGAGETLIVQYTRGGKRLVAALLNSPDRFSDTAAMFEASSAYYGGLTGTVTGRIDTERYTTRGAGWSTSTYSPTVFNDGYGTLCSTTASYVTLDFYGSKVEVIAPTNTNRGKADFSVDGGAVTTVDLYSNSVQKGVTVFSASQLAPDVRHTLLITVRGDKNPSASAVTVGLDEWRVTRTSVASWSGMTMLGVG